MDEKHNEIFRQYNLKVFNMYRARGAFILETNQGIKLLKSFDGSPNHLEFEYKIKKNLWEQGYENTDMVLRNELGELITQDSVGSRYVLKNWFVGDECNLRSLDDVIRATKNLAQIHLYLQEVTLTQEEVDCNHQGNVIELYEKHNRELKRVRSYVREKKKKNEFETCFLTLFDLFYEQAIDAVDALSQSQYKCLLECSYKACSVNHGNYNYHNIIFMKEQCATVNFEKANIGLQLYDLYQLLRKTMEKNNWQLQYGNRVIEEYCKIRELSKEECHILYISLLYPEKFWKVVNFYYNNKKSWMSQRNIVKLKSLYDQQKEKEIFLRDYQTHYM